MVDHSGSDTEEYDYEDYDLFFHVMLLPAMPDNRRKWLWKKLKFIFQTHLSQNEFFTYWVIPDRYSIVKYHPDAGLLLFV